MSLPAKFLVLISVGSTAAWANAIVNTELDLISLQIIPTSGTLQLLSPVTAFTFAQALDSLGGFNQNANSVNDAATSVSAATMLGVMTLGSATATTSALDLTESVKANVNVPNNLDVFSSPSSQALLSGMFEITGTTGSVRVNITAFLALNRFLMTSGSGVSAFSDASFTLMLPDISPNPVLSFDDLLTIGPGQSPPSYVTGFPLTTSLMVPANTLISYYGALEIDPTAVGTVPEPASLLLTAIGLAAMVGRTRRVQRRAGAKAPVAG